MGIIVASPEETAPLWEGGMGQDGVTNAAPRRPLSSWRADPTLCLQHPPCRHLLRCSPGWERIRRLCHRSRAFCHSLLFPVCAEDASDLGLLAPCRKLLFASFWRATAWSTSAKSLSFSACRALASSRMPSTSAVRSSVGDPLLDLDLGLSSLRRLPVRRSGG